MRSVITHETHACMWNGCVAPLVLTALLLIIGPMKIKGEKYRLLVPHPAQKRHWGDGILTLADGNNLSANSI